MIILHYLFVFMTVHTVDACLIQNQYKPICANCKFFIPNKNVCSKFGDINIITGDYTYEPADSVRKDEQKCGKNAIYFKQNNFKFITRPYYFMVENSREILLLSYGFLPFIVWAIGVFTL